MKNTFFRLLRGLRDKDKDCDCDCRGNEGEVVECRKRCVGGDLVAEGKAKDLTAIECKRKKETNNENERSNE